jgi:c-di-GMP-binding flagellar brake protein YcgR
VAVLAEEQDILREAISRNAGIVLTLISSGMMRHCKSRFLCETDGKILVESVPAETPLIEEMIRTTKPAGVSFKSGHTKVVFAAPLVERLPEYRINSTVVLQAVRLAWPTQIKSIQRRTNYRVRVGTDAELSARVWRIGPKAILRDKPLASCEIPAQLLDLSMGGMGVTLSAPKHEPLRVDPADRLRVEISTPDREMLVEARMVHPDRLPRDAKSVRAGLQFADLQNDLEGRQVLALLTKLLGELKRAEIRRARLGLMQST